MKTKAMRKVFVMVLLMMSFTTFSQVPELMYYKFDATGSQQNFASSPVGTNPAVLNGLTVGSTGQFGTALIGNGASSSTNRLNTGWATNLPSTGWTISFWLNSFPSTSASLAYYFGDNTAASFRCFTGGVAPTSGMVIRATGLTDTQINSIPSTPTVIHIVYTGTAMQIYMNGLLTNTVAQSPVTLSGTGPFLVGGYSSSAGINSGTLMDEFRLYNRALTATEIAATWNVSLGSATDAGIVSIVNPLDTICAGPAPIDVILTNFGPNALTSVTINSTVNGVTQPVHNWTGNLPVNDSVFVNIGSYNFVSGTPYSIKAWTTDPNAGVDSTAANDTSLYTGLVVLPALTATVTPAGPVVFCDADSVLLTINAPGSNTFQWYYNGNAIQGATSTNYYISQQGTYYAIYGDGLCSGKTDTIAATSNPSPLAVISTYTPTTFCTGDSVWMFANLTTGYSYQWQRDGVDIPGDTNSTYLAMLSGLYTVTTIHGPCSTVSAAVIVNAKPLHPVDLGIDMVVCDDIVVTLDAGAGADTYLWSTGATAHSIQVDTTGIGLGTTAFSVTATLDGCTNADTIELTFITCTGIASSGSHRQFVVYPNPGDGLFTLRIGGLKGHNARMQIFDIAGREVYSKDRMIGTDSEEIVLDADFLNPGVYFLRVSGNPFVITEKIIVR